MIRSIPSPTTARGLESYVIQGGRAEAERLGVLSKALAPTTDALLDEVGSLAGLTVVDAACGSGDVTLELARRVGFRGQVIGLDLDGEKLAIADGRAGALGLKNCRFLRQNVTDAWPVRKADIVYARFILTHLQKPSALLARAVDALVPGGMMVAEDIDADGLFCEPESAAMERLKSLYIAVARRNGGDPLIGKRLGSLFAATGLADVQTRLVQPYGAYGPAKDAVVMTYHAIWNSVAEAELATRDEMQALLADLDAFAAHPAAVVGMPRIFQAWGRKS